MAFSIDFLACIAMIGGMASLRMRKGVWYLDYRYNGKRYQKSTKTSDKKLAMIKLAELEVQIFKGDLDVAHAPKRSETIGAHFQKFRRFIDENYSKAYVQTELSRLFAWQEYFARKGVIRLADIHEGHVDDFLTNTLEGRKAKTKRNYLGLLQTCLNKAVKWKVIDANPIVSVSPPKVEKKFHYYSSDQVQSLIGSSSEPLKTAIILLVNTGLRRSELLNLRWHDVNTSKKVLTVMPYGEFKTKGKRPRTVPLNAEALQAMKRLRRKASSEYVYQDFYPNAHNLTDQFRYLSKKFGTGGTLHSLRHTFASHLAMAGTPIPVIKELLGHSDIATTMIYAHLSPQIHKAEVEKLQF